MTQNEWVPVIVPPGPLAWAHRILARAKRGETLPYISIKFAREALELDKELDKEEEAA